MTALALPTRISAPGVSKEESEFKPDGPEEEPSSFEDPSFAKKGLDILLKKSDSPAMESSTPLATPPPLPLCCWDVKDTTNPNTLASKSIFPKVAVLWNDRLFIVDLDSHTMVL
mmetsp:Transcript_91092/g.254536  ORF Transcript_91092/g.254536 Transcript_91092/m.254536 type:complete len:114 (+) Transcript_91092:1553-1894(+)